MDLIRRHNRLVGQNKVIIKPISGVESCAAMFQEVNCVLGESQLFCSISICDGMWRRHCSMMRSAPFKCHARSDCPCWSGTYPFASKIVRFSGGPNVEDQRGLSYRK